MRRAVRALSVVIALLAGGHPASAQPGPPGQAAAPAQAPVTFAKDVAPIIYAKCGVCHRPGGAAPFSLLTYGSARGHATQIAQVTKGGFMPPWQADADYGGSFIMSDQTLLGNIVCLYEANQYLYIFGRTSLDILSDVRIGLAPGSFSTYITL